MKDLENVLSKLGGGRCSLGYHFTKTVMEILLADENRFLNLYRRVYPQVAEEYGVKLHCVERNIRTFIKECYLNGNRSFFNEMARCELKHMPSVKEFLDILLNNLKK